MKVIVVFTALILSAQLTWSAETVTCDGEAQFVGKVEKTELAIKGTQCNVIVSEIKFFLSNQFCPMEQSELETTGLFVGVDKDGLCKKRAGEAISGVAIKSMKAVYLDVAGRQEK